MKTTWSISYAGMAIGPFDNKIIFYTNMPNVLIMQISIIDKNPYKL